MGKMAVIAHGGAGPGPERQENLQKAVDVATELLLAGASAIEAAVEAVLFWRMIRYSTLEREGYSGMMAQSSSTRQYRPVMAG